MSNKKFFLGLAAGLIGGALFPKIKNQLKPLAVKLVQGVLAAGDETKKLVEEVSEEAKKNRDQWRESSADEYLNMDIKQLAQGEQQISENVRILQEQLTEMEEKIK
jgi:polyhydroxyalkanoate synthesis regulator phasin